MTSHDFPSVEHETGRARRRLQTLALCLALFAATFALAQSTDRVKVVATVGMIGDLAAEVAGECADVVTMMGPGSDPHLYRASASDVRALQTADLVLYGGHHLEGRLSDVLGATSSGTPTLAVSEVAVSPDELILDDGGPADPHVWLDASLWARVPQLLADALTSVDAFDPACVEPLQERADELAAQLLALHGWALESFATVPERQRVLVTAHDAFQYFGRAYGLEVVGVQGVSTETEAAVADIRRVIDVVVEYEVPMLFVESTINPRTVQAVQEGVAQRGGSGVEIGPELYADALGSAGTPQGTYIGMFVHDVIEIVTGLGGTAEPLPVELHDWQQRMSFPAPLGG